MRLKAIIGVLAVLISAPVYAETEADVAKLVSWMTGEFNAKAQFAALGPEKARLRVAFSTKLDMPNIPGTVTFVEWRDPDANGPVTSQRIWTYTAMADGIAMHFYTLNATAEKVLTGIHSSTDPRAAAAKALTIADLNAYPDNCTFMLRKRGANFEGQNGSTCTIFNRRLGTNMNPMVLMHMDADGYIEDGTFVYEAVGTTPAKTERIVQDFKRVK
ncbi:MAG: hypothetical protein EXR11_10575 [Rhodospirillaceae bacterium]|nr:hypothetical protein [Rhodospirillaceae bacterium]